MEQRNEPTGWVGWVIFAAMMMILVGALQGVYGLVALLNDEWVVWGERGAVFFDVTTWGWIHLIAGIVLVLAGIGVLSGNIVARVVGVTVALLSAVGAFMSLPLFPVWSIVIITIDVLVVWALTAHGAEMRRA